MKRPEVEQLVALGRFPSSHEVNLETIRQQEKLVRAIRPPVSDDEAKDLVKLFGPDDYFGAAWTLLHLVETAPSWPIQECLTETTNEWVARLKESAKRAGKM